MTNEPGVDIHVEPYTSCFRCMMDVLLFGEGWWDEETLAHLNPNDIKVDDEGCYTVIPDPITMDDLLKKMKKSSKVAV